jgi:leader peptidase (prepilin peptidase)/N-methyltransferase
VSRDLSALHRDGRKSRLEVGARVGDRAVVRSLRVRRRGGSIVADLGPAALLWIGLPALVGITAISDSAALPAAATVAVLVPAAAVDIRERRLPDSWVLAAAVVLLATTWVAWLFGQTFDATALALGALVMAGPMMLVHLVSPGAMGFGDVKTGVVLGAALGTVDWRLGLVALTLAAGLGAAVGAARRSATIPFGPFLVLGAAFALVVDDVWLAALSNGGS